MKRGRMESQSNGTKPTGTGPGPTLSDVALRITLWVLYGGAAGEMVYGSKMIEEGMGTPVSGRSSRHAA